MRHGISLLGGAVVLAGLQLGVVSAVRGEADHLQGYKVKDLDALQPPGTYTVTNQFGSATCSLKKAIFLLAQSEKDSGDDARGGPAGNFVCFKAKCTGTLPPPTDMDDQFGVHTLETKKAKLVCVPAVTLVCGDGDIDPGEDCDGSATGSCASTCEPDCTCTPPPPCDPPGPGGYCWYFGSVAQSCDAVCAAQGKTYDPATATFAGSGGTDANCQSVLESLGQYYPPMTALSCSSTLALSPGLGCVRLTTSEFPGATSVRCADTVTTASAFHNTSAVDVARACACQ